jgi:hypothetical protein
MELCVATVLPTGAYHTRVITGKLVAPDDADHMKVKKPVFVLGSKDTI